LRYPMAFCHDLLLRVRLTQLVVYVTFIEANATFKIKAIVDPVNLVKKYDFVDVSANGCLCGVLQRLDAFIKSVDCKA
jgi:uncharacterized membrane protein YqhA